LLRKWFQDPADHLDPQYSEAVLAIGRYREKLGALIDQQTPLCARYTRHDIWCRGLLVALQELEESVNAAERFSERVERKWVRKMSGEERESYWMHIYFYKNALVRVFSVLDKLGYLLNEVLRLRTQRVKRKFSYFTVLRQMRNVHAEPDLTRQLIQFKESCQKELARLRDKRNAEIHLVNPEMLDDLLYIDACRTDETYIEDLSASMAELRKGFEMVCNTLSAVFVYLSERNKT
jgi:hypothetical protein